MKLKLYQIDAFTDRVFGGNPAAVCPLTAWISDDLMQRIAMENNLAETAFIVTREGRVEIRWFTPGVEVDLCGHATLAAAYALFNYESWSGNEIEFFSPRSGRLTVRRDGDVMTMNFPSDIFEEIPKSKSITAGLSVEPVEIFRGKTDYMLVYSHEDDVAAIVPDFEKIARLRCRGVIVTAPGKEVDFVSRFFAPQSGVNEDPVTGSAHTTLTPYWAKRLNRKSLSALQLSPRKGQLWCTDLGGRVEISGKAAPYLRGEISISTEHE